MAGRGGSPEGLRHTSWGWIAVVALSVGVAQPFRAASAGTAVSEPALVHVLVVDAEGRSVPNLTAADFEVLVDGTSAPVTSVAPRGTLSLAVVADTSRSAGWGSRGFSSSHDQVLAVLAGLRDDDRLRFGSFGPRVSFPARWQPRRGRDLRRELDQAFSADDRDTHGPSPIWDVVYDTVTMLAAEPPPRAILLLTDGRSTGNARSLDLVAAYAAGHGVAIHSVLRYREMQIPQGDKTAVIVRPWVSIERLTIYSGGTAVAYGTHQDELGLELAEKLGRSIRAGYALEFSPAAGGAIKRLDVRAKRSDLTVIAPKAFLPDSRRQTRPSVPFVRPPS